MKYHISDYDHIVPIGSNCRMAQALRDLKIKDYALPFDWTLTSCEAIYRAFSYDFSNFVSRDDCIEESLDHHPGSLVLNLKYNVNVTHERRITKEAIEKYNRKVERMLEILGSNSKVLFIRHHNDGDWIVNDQIHADYNKKELDAGYDPTDISYLYKLHELISKKYPKLEYDIVLFHYKDIQETDDKRIKFFKSKLDSDEDFGKFRSGTYEDGVMTRPPREPRKESFDHVQCIDFLKSLQNKEL